MLKPGDAHMAGGGEHTTQSMSRSIANDPMGDQCGLETSAYPPDLERAPPPIGEVYSVFTRSQRILIVAIAALAGLNSPLSGNIYVPALNSIAASLHITTELANLTVTTYMICQGLAPMFVGDIADTMGRRPAYLIAFTIYLAANIGLALQNNYVALLVLRGLQSTGSSGTSVLTFAIVADVSPSSERGTYIGWASSGLMLGLAVGPILGGLLSQYLGWHSTFWFLAVISLCVLLLIVFLLPETGRNLVENGSIPPPKWNMSLISYLQQCHARQHNLSQGSRFTDEAREKSKALTRQRKIRFPNPFKTLLIILEKDVALILLNISLLYVAYFDVITSLPQLFGDIYGFSDLQIGLSFIPYGIGCLASSIVGGRLMDWNFRRVANQHGFDAKQKWGSDLWKFPIEKARIQCALPMLYAGICFYIMYGWLLDFEVHYVGPLLLLLLIGLTINGSFAVSSTLLVDLYPQSAATAASANNLVRCSMGAGGTALINKMITAMGRGWCFTFIALILVAQSSTLWVLLRWGPRWREDRYIRMEASEVKMHATSDTLERNANSGNGF